MKAEITEIKNKFIFYYRLRLLFPSPVFNATREKLSRAGTLFPRDLRACLLRAAKKRVKNC
jgi:hypothetical protein